MSEEHDRLLDDLVAYVLGALEPADRVRVEAHVATCSTCTSRLAEYRAVVGVLSLGLPPAAPSRHAWSAIRAAARRRKPRRRWVRKVLPPALAAVVAGLVVWNVMLQRELTRRSPGPAPGPEVDALSRRPGRVVILTGTGQPGANARLFVAVDGGHGHLAISGLEPLPRERTYQLWFVRTGGPTASGATFGVDGRGRAWASVDIPASLDDVRAITVTEEPVPGSAVPTGRHLLDALPWR